MNVRQRVRPSNWKRFPRTVASTTKERLGGAVVSIVPDERTLPAPRGVPPWIAISNLLVLGAGQGPSLPRTEISEVVAQAGLSGRGRVSDC